MQGKGTTLIHKGRPHDHPAVTWDRVVEAVTFALAVVRRSLFEEQQFDINLDWDFNDADFCLQAGSRGYQVRYCAASTHFHLETVTRRKYGLHGKPDNRDYFMRKWRGRIDRAMSLDEFTRMEPYHR
jgi:GT2 family glycosyltransferase